jgi:hypothetical protein
MVERRLQRDYIPNLDAVSVLDFADRADKIVAVHDQVRTGPALGRVDCPGHGNVPLTTARPPKMVFCLQWPVCNGPISEIVARKIDAQREIKPELTAAS